MDRSSLMFLSRLVFTGCAILFVSTLCADEKNVTTNPIVQHLKAIDNLRPSQAEVEQGLVMQGAVKFVLNQSRLWFPGESFKNSDNWLALTCSQAECKLSPAKLVVQAEAWQGHYDEQPTQGQRLSFSLTKPQQAQVVAWFNTNSAANWLRPGPVTSYQSPLSAYNRPPLKGTLEVRINLPDSYVDLLPVVITQETMKRVWPEQRHYNSIKLLQLRDRGKRQLLLGRLWECDGFTSEVIKPEKFLRWAGDLDRDGLADYMISFIDVEGVAHLYLSGKTEQNKLVGLAGIYSSPPMSGECTGG